MSDSTNSKPVTVTSKGQAPAANSESGSAEKSQPPAKAEAIEQAAKPAGPAPVEKKALANNPAESEPSATDMAARLAQLEQQWAATKTELEAAKAAAEAAEVDKLRAQVAAAKSLPAELHEFLTSTTREALEAQADKLLAHVGKRRSAPAPDPTQGSSSSVPLNSSSLEAAFRRAFEK